MKDYLCPICGERHTVFPGMAIPAPELHDRVPEAEWSFRVKEFNDTYLIDGATSVVRGTLRIATADDDVPTIAWHV